MNFGRREKASFLVYTRIVSLRIRRTGEDILVIEGRLDSGQALKIFCPWGDSLVRVLMERQSNFMHEQVDFSTREIYIYFKVEFLCVSFRGKRSELQLIVNNSLFNSHVLQLILFLIN